MHLSTLFQNWPGGTRAQGHKGVSFVAILSALLVMGRLGMVGVDEGC